MKKYLIAILLVFMLIFSIHGGGIMAISADDFLAPAEGGTPNVEGEVTEEDGVVIAQTAQDGFNYANQELDFVMQNVKTVEFPSGLGFLAGGSHSYQTHENPDATLLEKRLAYVLAYTKAKIELAKELKGGESIAQEKLVEHMENIVTSTDTSVNLTQVYEEDIVQATEALLRGYVIYDVKDDTEAQTVTVTIATSNKTLSAVSNVSGGLVQTSSLNEGLDYVLKQITNGVVPPMGGRVITVPQTGQTAVVSFGSDILRQHENSNVEATMRQASQRAAQMRSLDAMVGIIEGDDMAWLGGLTTSQEFQSEDYAEIRNSNNELVERKVLDKTKQNFIIEFQQTDAYQSFREGRFPPGVNTRLYEDGRWIYAISVYLPNLTQQVEDFYDEMQDPDSNDSAAEQENDEVVSDEYQSGEDDIEQGPSGEVSQPGDL